MKKLSVTLLILIFGSGIAAGQNFSVGAKAGWYFPVGQEFKDIYGSGLLYGPDLVLDFGKYISLTAGLDVFNKSGSLSYTKEDVSVEIYRPGLGLRCRFFDGFVTPFLELGVNLTVFRETADFETAKRTDFGVFGGAGTALRIFRRLAVEIGVVYVYSKIKRQSAYVNIGGIRACVGLRYFI
jgi:hypothetical protein